MITSPAQRSRDRSGVSSPFGQGFAGSQIEFHQFHGQPRIRLSFTHSSVPSSSPRPSVASQTPSATPHSMARHAVHVSCAGVCQNPTAASTLTEASGQDSWSERRLSSRRRSQASASTRRDRARQISKYGSRPTHSPQIGYSERCPTAGLTDRYRTIGRVTG
jgi:hypothetical protein